MWSLKLVERVYAPSTFSKCTCFLGALENIPILFVKWCKILFVPIASPWLWGYYGVNVHSWENLRLSSLSVGESNLFRERVDARDITFLSISLKEGAVPRKVWREVENYHKHLYAQHSFARYHSTQNNLDPINLKCYWLFKHAFFSNNCSVH